MKREVYEALKPRIEITIYAGYWHYWFRNAGLNEGLGNWDYDFIESMGQPMAPSTSAKPSIWNCAQRVYSYLVYLHGKEVDARLLANPIKK